MTYIEFIKYVKEHTDMDFVLNVDHLIKNNLSLKGFIEYSNFTTAPASTKYHGNYEGGLLEHSVNVMDALCELTENNHLSWSRPESPIIVGLFHDICKIDAYKPKKSAELQYTNEDGVYEKIPVYEGYEYNNETLFKGHGDKSVMMLASLMQLTEEEVACIRYHMGAFTDKEEWNYYTRAIHKYPNVLWTHHADMIATHIMEVENV
jgi:hypothetical protein